RLSLDPDTARRMHEESLLESDAADHKYCSMCGPKFCSMKTSAEVRQMGRDERNR
ncbi:MAG: phosphomethylpyrimidine synthase ThiC, partial [Planctomycetes bacterium]|nr:phosphomethylpyrimidine synthase ThiC [Planctomycetota bacterium]